MPWLEFKSDGPDPLEHVEEPATVVALDPHRVVADSEDDAERNRTCNEKRGEMDGYESHHWQPSLPG